LIKFLNTRGDTEVAMLFFSVALNLWLKFSLCLRD
jgi:hypothetical protein